MARLRDLKITGRPRVIHWDGDKTNAAASGALGAGALFAVNVAWDGDGPNGPGSATTYCSYTYTATDPATGLVLGTALNPLHSRARAMMCRVDYANLGSGYYDSSGAFILWDVDETIQTAPCD
jgi:hypothetical protein